MARTAKRSKSAAKNAPKSAAGGAIKGGAIRPVLLAAGLGLYWFVENQDSGGTADMPMWGYVTMQGVRVLLDFVGAWVVVSALQLIIAVGRLGLTQLRTRWSPERS
jgi:hypothetical protein